MKNNEYLCAFEYFIDKMLSTPDTIYTDISEHLDRLCNVLKIGRITADMYNNQRTPDAKPINSVIFYDEPPCTESCSIVKNNVTADGNTVVYSAWHRAGEEEWDDEDVSRINRFLGILFMFNSHSRLRMSAEKLIFSDKDMDIPNLRFYLNYLGQTCAKGMIGKYAGIFANLRRYSAVNELIGRENGSKVMRLFIGKIKSEMSQDELVARVGGDNFVLLVRKDNLDNILAILSGTNIFFGDSDSDKVWVSATSGVYKIPDDGSIKAPTDVMDCISFASHIARVSGKTEPVYFNEELKKKSESITSISAKFPSALKNKEFKVYYQPKVSLDKYKVAGAEALCRWIHKGKLIPPNEFIPALESGMDICKLDFYMLSEVCSHLREWLDAGIEPVRVSVNLSRRHLSDMELSQHLLSIIDSYNIPHDLIEIELTETTTDVELQNLKRFVGEIQGSGISISVDDFGIGYSSLNLIKDIPWNVIKLDKSLVPEIQNRQSEQNKTLFKYVVAMAQAMGLECIAEGVESREQVDMLREYSCSFAQGFFFDKPLPKEEFEQKLSGFTYEV